VRGISDELRRQLIGPAGDAGEQAGQQSGSAFSEKWKAGLAVAGAAAGAVLVAATVSAVEKERMADRLSAQLGLSGAGAKQAGEVAGNLYSRAVVDSFEDGAAAVRAVMGSGLIDEKATTKAIESITTKVADLASTFDQDLVGTTNAATQLIRTGLAKDAPAALDLLTKGLQSSADKAGDFMDTINEYSTQFRKAGLDGATAIGLLNQAIRAGARDSDVAADAIKEFSIRAVDGSKTSIDGFKALGLNADDMAAKFAQGGSAANGVLDLTLDKLRGMKDPVKQSQTAVALFGTQAEDLGKALFAMDPSSAAAGLGKVGGAAKEVGDTIRSNTATELKILQRQLMSGVGVVVRAVVLPALQGMIEAIRWTGDAIAATGRWFQEWGAWLIPIAVLIGGITIALNAQAIATAAVTAVFSIYRAAILTGTAVTQGFAAAQALLNAVMALNPFVLIAIAVVALGAALVVAWKNSETFRSIVMAAWEGIQTAAMWAWNTILKPMIDGLIIGWKAVATGALWLWNTVLKPVFGFISTAARIVATIYAVVFLVAFKAWWTGVKLYVGLVMTALRAVGDAAMWLWEKAISPAINFIVGAFQLWWTGVKLYFSLVSTGFKTVGGWALWLYHKAVKPAFDLIVAAASLTWTGVKVVFGYFTTGLKTVGGWAKWLWEKAISPAMNGIKNVVSTVWNTGVKLTLNTMKTAIGQVGKAFELAKNAIKVAWDKVKGIAKAPVQFIVDTVYNRGLVGVWNKVAGAFGAPKLSTFKFASGGILPGYTPGRDPHRFYSDSGMALEMSGGEAIMRPEFTRGAGAGFVGYFNRLAKSRGAQGVREALAPVLGGNPATSTDTSLRYANGGVVQRFADGGIFGWIKSAGSAALGAGSATWNKIKEGAKWLTDTLEASARAGVRAVVNPLLKAFPGMDSGFGQMLRRIPTRMIDALFGYSKEADKKGAGGIGGPKVQSALRWARTQNGLPYQWGGNGDPSWDCSGFMSAIESVIRGQKPHRRWSTHAFQGGAPPGWVKNGASAFRVGITHAGVGHTAGTLGGVNVESRGGDGVVVGPRARGYNNRLFTSWYGFQPGKYDSGGWLRPGITAAVNATGQPEAVLTASQWRVMSAAASTRAAGLQAGDQLRLVVDGREFSAYVDARADGRVQAGQQSLIQFIEAS
jgi:phage-related minor tail protein